MKITIIGSGNVATHLALRLKNIGEQIAQVYSPHPAHAEALAHKIGCEAVTSVDAINDDSDIYLFSIKDDALPVVAKEVENHIGKTHKHIFIHTAGSVPMDVFSGITECYGVIYPMQTFSKDRAVDFVKIPCFIEASDCSDTLYIIEGLAKRISAKVQRVDSEKRKRLHLAAVFANNFTNHCYRLAEKMLEGTDVPLSMYLPLIEETANKVREMSPRDAQTGPMVRNDVTVMERQLALIPDERTKKLYHLMAESIHEDSKM